MYIQHQNINQARLSRQHMTKENATSHETRELRMQNIEKVSLNTPPRKLNGDWWISFIFWFYDIHVSLRFFPSLLFQE